MRCRWSSIRAAADGLNADFVGRLDRAVDTMLADGLAVEIDMHPEDATSSSCAAATTLWID